MGDGIILNCKKCGYQKDFIFGIGFMYGDLMDVIETIPKKHREEIYPIVKNYDVHPLFEQKVFKCNKCNGLYNKLWVKMDYDGNKTYETKYKCYKCKIDLEKIDFDLDNEKNQDFKFPDLICPKCGFKYLDQPMIILWD